MLYKSRLSACEIFKQKSVDDRAQIVEQHACCALCLDWSGTHQRDKCDAKIGNKPFPLCDITTNNVACNRPHNRLLHGTLRAYCLHTRKGRVVGHAPEPKLEDLLSAPTQDEILQDDDVLMSMQ